MKIQVAHSRKQVYVLGEREGDREKERERKRDYLIHTDDPGTPVYIPDRHPSLCDSNDS